jgi:hypothetical protein
VTDRETETQKKRDRDKETEGQDFEPYSERETATDRKRYLDIQ